MVTGGLWHGSTLQIGDERVREPHGLAKAEWAGGWWADSKNEKLEKGKGNQRAARG
jgi:hypothetical protein